MATQAEIITLITAEIKALSDEFDSDDYTNATNDASRETGWAFPVTTAFKILWMKNRSKRYLFSYLLAQSVTLFRVKAKYLNQQWEHLAKTIKDMDDDFLAVIESRPEQFANVDVHMLFGTKIDAGFSYEGGTGRDTTYSDDQVIIFKPTA